ncbi:MAG: LamG domain-containing protein, partial [Planctomycetaceae bacterium]|nr:LamG domain-containing protein [Planctomycetaceae bacterium]
DSLKLYIDGKQVSQSTKFDPAKYNLNAKGPLKIGFGQHDYFNGKMKDLRIYDRELSPREIARVLSAAN